MVNIIRIPDSDSADYDRYVTVPEGKTPEDAVAEINRLLNKLSARAARGDYEYTGTELEDVLKQVGSEFVVIHDTVEW